MHVAADRVVARAPAVIRWQPTDQDGEPIVATGTPTVVVTRADGTSVTPVTIGIVAGVVELTLTAAQTATLDRLTVSWLLDAVVRGTSTVDVVGGVYTSVAAVRLGEPSLADVGDYSDAMIRSARVEVESMVERAVNHVLAFVPRFDTAIIREGYTSVLPVPHYFVRAVRWARSQDSAGLWSSIDITGGVSWTNGYLSLNGWWPRARVEVGYEHGLDAPPPDLRRAAVQAIRRQLNKPRSGIDPRAMSFTSHTGETQRFPTPGLGPWVTGVPEIDEVLAWYRTRYPVVMVA